MAAKDVKFGRDARERILAGAILGMAGPGRKIAGLMTLTVVRPDDLADRILDRDKHPQWQGERTKMVYSLPKNEKLWAEYARVRAEGLRADRGIVDATAFYGKHRTAMDDGAVIAWPERFSHDELSAVQHAMNLRLQNEAAFFAEYQNEPLPEISEQDEALTPDQIMLKVNGHDRGVGQLAPERAVAPELELACVRATAADPNERTPTARALFEEIERDLIQLAIEVYAGHMSEVARRLGIGRSTLYRKLTELGIGDAA